MIQKKSTLYKQKNWSAFPACDRPCTVALPLHPLCGRLRAVPARARICPFINIFFVRTFLSFRFLFLSLYSAKSSKLTPEPAFTSCLSVFPVISSRNFGLIPGVRTFSVRKTATSPFFIFSPAFMSFIKCRLRFVRP